MMKTTLPLRWMIRMAIRDSRRSWRDLLLLVLSAAAGAAALVSMRSFKESLEGAIHANAKPLLGADFVVKSRSAFTPETHALFSRFGDESSEEIVFASMALFPKSGGSRLVQVNAISGEYPYYGMLETDPAEAAEQYKAGRKALVDEGLLHQFGAAVGDKVVVGGVALQIAGALKRVPGVIDARNAIAPRIYLRTSDLEGSGLLAKGSRARYNRYFKAAPGFEVSRLVEEHQDELLEQSLQVETIEDRKESLGRNLDRVYAFLDLIAFVALVLGCLGVGSAAHVYLQGKAKTISLLRCLGASATSACGIFFLELAAFGALSVSIGVVAGVSIERILPIVLEGFLPVDVSLALSYEAVLISAGVTLLLLLLFALGPLLAVRRIPPLASLRSAYEERTTRDPLRYALWAAIFVFSSAFAALHTGSMRTGLGYAVGIFAAAGLLAGCARAAAYALRRWLPHSVAFSLRQGLANLYRPRNQTRALMLCVGMGVFLPTMVSVTESAILSKAAAATAEGRPNLVLFDIQQDQLESVRTLLEEHQLSVLEQAAIVNMRLSSIKNVSVETLRADERSDIPEWTLTREYRSTYRGTLTETETLIEGTHVRSVAEDERPVPVSLEEGIAERLKVEVGDSLGFNVQGVEIAARVAGIREVDWQQIRPNFFVVFPEGLLEEAPQFHVLVTRTETPEASAAIQKAVVSRFPNISIIDVTLVLKTLDDVLERLGLVVRFLGGFTILAALVVLTGAVLNSRYQRAEECLLLKTLGASRRTVVQITLAEYAFLGLLGTVSGVILAMGAGWLLSVLVFETELQVSPYPVAAISTAALGVTVLVGVLGSRGIYSKNALDILRTPG